jgi:putative heme-binding domain-containing protein
LNTDVLNPKGSGYVGSHGPDFLLTGDKASQILNLRYGPDGQAWMIDWYDMQACHLSDPGKHDRSNGRIYKIVYGDFEQSQTVDLGKATDLELAKHMLHPNDWYVRHSRRLLQQRAAAGKVADEAVTYLKQLTASDPSDTRRLRGAWALAAMERLDAATCEAMLVDKSEYVRGWGVQLGLESKLAASAVTPSKLAKLAVAEPSPVTRLYLAAAAQRIPVEQRWALVRSLIENGGDANASDAKDHNLPLMIWYAAEPLADVDLEQAMELGMDAGSSLPTVRNNMLRRIGASSNAQAMATLVKGLGQAKTEEVEIAFLDAIRLSLAGRRKVEPPAQWESLYAKLSKGETSVQRLAQAVGVTFGNEAALASVRVVVESNSESTEARQNGIATLLAAKDPKLAPVLQSLLSNKELRITALAALGQYSDPKTSSSILSIYSTLSQTERRAAIAALASRVEYAIPMLEAVEAKRIPATDLSADLVRQLEYLKDDKVKSLLEKSWGTVRESPEEKVKLVQEYKTLALSTKEPKPDVSLGRAVYAKTCQQCHVLFATGGIVGPELTGSNRANLDYLLSNIVDPSSVMAKEYQPAILNCDGRVVTGIVKAEDSKAITLQKADGIEIIPLSEIEERKLSEKSMMPEDQLKLFSKHEIRSLIAYLASDRQMPILATPENAQEFFNGKDLTNWRGEPSLWSVVDGEIVGKTASLDKNSFLVSDFVAEDFHLKLEVKLVGNAGNSGIQFRSQTTAEGMMGYQADIGPGWWGKLYEEEGRALLWDKSGEAHVKNGDWNVYEVHANGTHIQTWINGQPCVDLDDPKGAKRGVIGLQLHSGGQTEVRFRNIELKIVSSPLAMLEQQKKSLLVVVPDHPNSGRNKIKIGNTEVGPADFEKTLASVLSENHFDLVQVWWHKASPYDELEPTILSIALKTKTDVESTFFRSMGSEVIPAGGWKFPNSVGRK